VKWVSKKPILESISHSLDSGEDSQILEKKKKQKREKNTTSRSKERKKEGKMRSSHPQTLPLRL
jgi:hypothetical protein